MSPRQHEKHSPTAPRQYEDLKPAQLEAVEAIVEKKRLLLFMKPGGGKTASVLTALQELKAYPALVVAPKRVCELVWAQEAQAWAHLQGIKIALLRGSPTKRLVTLLEPADVYLINYELLQWLATNAPENWFDSLQALVWDEVSMMKSPGARRFRAMRSRIKDVPVKVGMTGTPVGNNLINLYGEAHVVAGDECFGRSFIRFKLDYFLPVDKDHFIWRPRPDAEERLMEKLRPWAISVPVESPTGVIMNPTRIKLPRNAQKMVTELSVNKVLRTDGGEMILSGGPMVDQGRLRQICSGAIYTDPNRQGWASVHDEKMKAFWDLYEELEGAGLLVFYEYRHELERIQAKCPWARTLDKESARLWNERKIDLLLLHPKSGGHGLNLQHGGSDVLWFSLPWSFEYWTQGNGRLIRPGQAETVVIHTTAAVGTIEEQVQRNLNAHQNVEDRVFSGTRRSA